MKSVIRGGIETCTFNGPFDLIGDQDINRFTIDPQAYPELPEALETIKTLHESGHYLQFHSTEIEGFSVQSLVHVVRGGIMRPINEVSSIYTSLINKQRIGLAYHTRQMGMDGETTVSKVSSRPLLAKEILRFVQLHRDARPHLGILVK
jgi:hypothetical protein